MSCPCCTPTYVFILGTVILRHKQLPVAMSCPCCTPTYVFILGSDTQTQTVTCSHVMSMLYSYISAVFILGTVILSKISV